MDNYPMVREGSAKMMYHDEPQAASTPPLRSLTAELEKRVAEAHELITQLGGRLDPILAPEPPQAAGSPSDSVPHRGDSDLVRHVANINQAVRQLCNRIEGIARRVEL